MAEELADSLSGRLEERFLKPFVLERLCELTSETLSCGDLDALRLARLCCRVAQHLKTSEARALSFGRLASALRLADRLGHAERALAVAQEAAPDRLAGDLLRRRASIRIYQGRLSEAVKDAKRALEETFGPAEAKCYEVLGVALFLSGDQSGGTQQLERCLVKTDPDSETAYCNAIQNYAGALAQGTEEHMKRALGLCRKARSMLRRRHKMQRAKLWWIEGLLQFRLGRLKKAWRALNTARCSLAALQAAPEVAAIIADMARVSPEPLAIRQLCRETAGLITGRHPLTRPLRALARSAQDWIPETAAALRREASTLVPCLAL